MSISLAFPQDQKVGQQQKPARDSLRYRTNVNYQYELDFYKIYKKKVANIVMLGNSITHGVNWNELLGRDDVVDRGIPGDNLDGIFNRLDFVFEVRPKICFIMAGINDIYNWTAIQELTGRYVQILTALQEKGIKVVVTSTLFVSNTYTSAADRNAEVMKLNDFLQKYCKAQKIDYIDLNAKLASNRTLKTEFTYDGLHLKPNAYKLWAQEIERILFRNVP